MRTYAVSAILPITVLLYALWLPLDAIVQVGGDDGYELSKALFLKREPGLADKIWNDQPWLHTMLGSLVFHLVGENAAGLRWINVLSFASMLFCVSLALCRHVGAVGAITAGLLMATSNNILFYAYSAMLEVPAVSWAVIAMLLPVLFRQADRNLAIILSGALVGCALSIKLTAAIVLPAGLLCYFYMTRSKPRLLLLLAGFGACLLLTFFTISSLSPSVGINQLLFSHFGSGHSINGVTADDYRFNSQWLLKELPLALSALLGAWLMWGRNNVLAGFATLLLLTSMAIALFHAPYWDYYHIHLIIPMSILGGMTMQHFADALREMMNPAGLGVRNQTPRNGLLSLAPTLTFGIVSFWLAFCVPRTLDQAGSIQNMETISQSPVHAHIMMYKHHTKYMYTLQPAIAFHSGILLPPELIVVPLKRLWSGDLTLQKILQVTKEYMPEQLLLQNRHELADAHWREFLRADYVMVHSDVERGWQLWVRRDIVPTLPERDAPAMELRSRFGFNDIDPD